MAKSRASYINHLGSVMYKVRGYGTLLTTAYGYNSADSSDLPDITLSASGKRMPIILGNFKQQKIQIEFRTEEIDEVLIISEITPFVIPVEAEYPR